MASGENNGYVRNSTFIGVLTVVVAVIGISGGLIVNNYDTRYEALKEDVAEAKKSSAEALRSALTARPDPFTGTDGKDLENDLREHIDQMASLIRAEDRAASARDDARFTGMDLRLQDLEMWKREDMKHKDDCTKERQELKDRLRDLERRNGT